MMSHFHPRGECHDPQGEATATATAHVPPPQDSFHPDGGGGSGGDLSSPRSTNTDVNCPDWCVFSSADAASPGPGSDPDPDPSCGPDENHNLKPIDEAAEEGEETATEVALLLTSVADIASREIGGGSSPRLPCFPDLAHSLAPPSDDVPERGNEYRNNSHVMEYETVSDPQQHQRLREATAGRVDSATSPNNNFFPALLHFDHKKKMRAVSMDSPELRGEEPEGGGGGNHTAEEYRGESGGVGLVRPLPALMQWRIRGEGRSPDDAGVGDRHSPLHGIFSTPPPSPCAKKRHGAAALLATLSEHRRPSYGGDGAYKIARMGGGGGGGALRPRSVSEAGSTANAHYSVTAASVTAAAVTAAAIADLSSPGGEQQQLSHPLAVATTPMKVILRKKFSWKNFPELEAFLIANREEYLRHSTLNYTMQQKEYNNRLTERMIQLAAHHGYVFDETDFSFVTVRDRIRCYFKSYVQSMKKRGVVIGYAARKAGLVSERELEESAHTSGKIYVPLGDAN